MYLQPSSLTKILVLVSGTSIVGCLQDPLDAVVSHEDVRSSSLHASMKPTGAYLRAIEMTELLIGKIDRLGAQQQNASAYDEVVKALVAVAGNEATFKGTMHKDFDLVEQSSHKYFVEDGKMVGKTLKPRDPQTHPISFSLVDRKTDTFEVMVPLEIKNVKDGEGATPMYTTFHGVFRLGDRDQDDPVLMKLGSHGLVDDIERRSAGEPGTITQRYQERDSHAFFDAI